VLADSLDQSKHIQMDPKLFNNVLMRIQRILRYNYLDALYVDRRLELLSIPTLNHKAQLPKLGFNSIGQDAKANPGLSNFMSNKNPNIFEIMLTNK
jgi:hypothetical protein